MRMRTRKEGNRDEVSVCQEKETGIANKQAVAATTYQ